MDAIQRAQLLKEELDKLRPISRENEMRIMQKFRLDWNYHSNNLEGNSLTYGETKALILFGLTAQGKPFKDHLEMTGHNEAIEWIEEIVKEEQPLTQSFIRNLHKLLLKESYQVDAITATGEPTKKWVTVGDYKKTPNHVQTKTGEIFRFASVEETPAKMTDLVDWFQEEKEKENYNVIVTAIEFHYRFIRIHPFDDGNGRTARILMNFILMQSGYPPVIIKTGDKQAYIAALEQADSGLFDPFINYITENLCGSLELMIKGAKGESVEEDDDIDKEIKILGLRIRSLGGKVQKSSVQISVNEFSETTLKPVLQTFLTAAFSFEKFFIRYLVNFPTSFNSNNMLVSGTSEEILEEAIAQFKRYDELAAVKLSILFDNLNYGTADNSYMYLGIKMLFDDYHFEISAENFKVKLLYTEVVSKEILDKLSREVKKAGVQNIDSIISSQKNKN